MMSRVVHVESCSGGELLLTVRTEIEVFDMFGFNVVHNAVLVRG